MSVNEFPKISAIIPVYNVEDYIEKCAESLMKQTLEEVEYIFIDDCSTDKSLSKLLETIDRFPERKDCIKIIKNSSNKGVSLCRQKGIDDAKGEYIYFCDSDDWTELNILERMYESAFLNNADMVRCNYFREYSNASTKMTQEIYSSKIKNIRDLFKGKVQGYLPTYLINREFILRSKVRFIQNLSCWEDLCFLIDLHWKTEKVISISDALYHYNRDVLTSLTKSNLHRKHLSCLRAIEYLRKYDDDPVIKKNLEYRLNYFFFYFISQIEHYNPKLWLKEYASNLETVGVKVKMSNALSTWLVKKGMFKLNFVFIKLNRYYRAFKSRFKL